MQDNSLRFMKLIVCTKFTIRLLLQILVKTNKMNKIALTLFFVVVFRFYRQRAEVIYYQFIFEIKNINFELFVSKSISHLLLFQPSTEML